jgi:hypothetical protein
MLAWKLSSHSNGGSCPTYKMLRVGFWCFWT